MADLELEERPRPLRKLLWAGVGLAIAGVLMFLGWSMLQGKPAPRPKAPPPVQIVELPPPPPPPPPPPEPEIVEPEPEAPEIEEAEIPQEPAPDEAPPEPEQAQAPPGPPGPEGLDAEGEAGSDAFGLRGTPGGRGLFGSGAGGGGGGYGDYVQGLLTRALQNDAELKRGRAFTIELQVVLADDGRIQAVNITRSSGTPEVDDRVRQLVAEVGRVEQRRDGPTSGPLRIIYQGRRGAA